MCSHEDKDMYYLKIYIISLELANKFGKDDQNRNKNYLLFKQNNRKNQVIPNFNKINRKLKVTIILRNLIKEQQQIVCKDARF